MKTTELVAEVSEAKRFTFNAKTKIRSETYKASAEQKENGNGETVNVYRGVCVQAEEADFASPAAVESLAKRIKADLYDGEQTPFACLADVLNNGGLRLAYRDVVLAPFKVGGTSNVAKIKVEALNWLIANRPADLGSYSKLTPEQQTEFLVKVYNTDVSKQ